MRAIVQTGYGPPERVLALGELPEPEVADDDVLVRVKATSVNTPDWIVTAGVPYVLRLKAGLRGPSTPVRGSDVAGVVEAVGARVQDLRPGDEVFGVGRGTFAEYTTAKTVVRKPSGLTFEQAAAVAVSGCTALAALRGVTSGQRVMVIGAGGGVGSYAVQLAVAFGAEVTGVCGPRKVDLVRSLGAATVIDYTSSALTGRYDVVVDIAGSRPFPVLQGLLTPRGTLALIGSEEGGRWIGALDRQFGALARRPFTRQRLRSPITFVRPAALAQLQTLLADGTITPAVDQTFALGDVPAAITYLREGKARGKIVVTP
jgi:NADPH:quinone reductase-like Zn-dependent oxidoreductase